MSNLIKAWLLTLSLMTQIVLATSPASSFIQATLPAIQSANQQISQQRAFLLANQYSTDPEIIPTINSIAAKYKVNPWQISSPRAWDKLLAKVDVWPNSMVLAQAIIESGFGKSRFAKQAHNLFGIWCYRKGCGLVPLQRSSGQTHEVRKFKTIRTGIDFYLLNLNTHPAYKKLRATRLAMRFNRQQLSSLKLCQHLAGYAAIGKTYPANLTKLIQRYDLQQWDY